MDWNDPWAEPDHDDDDEDNVKTTHARSDDDESHDKNGRLKQYDGDNGGDAGLTTKVAETHVATGAFALGTFGGEGVWDEPWGRDEGVVDGVWGAEVASAPVHVPTPAPAPAHRRDEDNGGWGDEIGHLPMAAPAHAVEKAEEDDGGWGDVDFSTPKQEDVVPSTRQREEDVLPIGSAWDVGTLDTEERKESEASDSATTIQADDDAHTASLAESTDSLQPDDDVSTRPSTTPSEVSRVEGGSESPRTSFEEERRLKVVMVGVDEVERKEDDVEEVKKDDGVEVKKEDEEEVKKDLEEVKHEDVETVKLERVDDTKTDDGDDFGDFEEDAVEESAPSPPGPLTIGSQTFNSDLLAQLFPPSSTKDTQNSTQISDEPLEDPVYLSSGTRKAWYRVTRKQTLREYNSGDDYDHYIRVTWKTSNVRSEVNKVVSRWATEDRMAGRGPGARASFYWDTPGPIEEEKKKTRAFHRKQSSSISASSPLRQNTVPPIQTDVPTAAFGWSTSPAANPWAAGDNEAKSILPSTSVPKHSAIAKLQRQEGRGVSVDLTPRPRDPVSHKRNATSGDLVKEVSTPVISPILPPPKPSTNQDINLWAGMDRAGMGALGTVTPPKQAPPSTTTAEDEDDDDWGEMVESPAISTMQTPFSDFSIPPPKSSAPSRATSTSPLSTPSSTPKKSANPSPLHVSHAVPTGSKNARPIVRLKGTVSPTSAIFKANAFVPAGVEQGPIGPGILKSRAVSGGRTVTLEKNKIEAPPKAVAQIDEVMNEKMSTEMDGVDNGFSAFETSLPEPEPAPQQSAPSPSRPPEPIDNSASWADSADFSIFESSVPAPAPVPAATLPSTDPTDDPWSFFDPPPAQPFTRPPPRPVTPPPKLPLTGATNSAQRRKMEEDEIIREIVQGLPWLGYMLKQ